MDFLIRELSPELIEDYLGFFDTTAFSDNPEWAGCYCCFYHCTNQEWDETNAAKNRRTASQKIAAGSMHGFLAYAGGMPVAWCHVDLRRNLARLKDMCGEEDENKRIASIVCFVVAPEFRGKGAAKRLLEHILLNMKGRCDIIEAYPNLKANTAAHHYHGPLKMYLNCGFEQTGGDEHTAIVRYKLN